MPQENNLSIEAREWVATLVKQVFETQLAHTEALERRVEGLEQQLAATIMGFSQMAAVVETLMTLKMKEFDNAEFEQVLNENVQKMVQVLADGTQQANAEQQRFYPGSPAATPDSEG